MFKEKDVAILAASYSGEKFKDFVFVKVCDIFSDSFGGDFYRVSDLDETIFGYVLATEIRQVN